MRVLEQPVPRPEHDAKGRSSPQIVRNGSDTVTWQTERQEPFCVAHDGLSPELRTTSALAKAFEKTW